MKNHNLRKSIILSIALHILLFGGMLLFSLNSEKRRPETVTVDVISPEEAARLMAERKPIDVPNNQIVEQDENVVNEQAPDEKTRFLSAKNQTVKKQSVAVNKGDFQNTKKNSPPAGKTKTAETAATEKTEKLTHEQQVKNLFAGYDPSESSSREKKRQEQAQEKAGQGGTEGAQGTGDVSRNNDHVKDVDQGLETLLNTREFKYYSYYNRIRRQLAQHWEGKVREKLTKMYREKRAPANLNEDRITKVIVVLNAAGTLVKVQVLSDSGIRDLDDAAVEAFRAAAPFPNPPKGIVEPDGTVKIRWDFVLES